MKYVTIKIETEDIYLWGDLGLHIRNFYMVILIFMLGI